MEKRMNKKNQLLTIGQVASMLQIATKTVRKYVWQKSIPYLKICGHVRFDESQIQKWISERQVPTLEDIQHGKISNPSKVMR